MLSVHQSPDIQAPPVFNTWNCNSPALPPRSRLYSLDPVAVGTAFVESLTGYVARLADAHAVSVGDLVGRELSAAASRPVRPLSPSLQRSRPDSHGFHAQGYAVNGLTETAKKWVAALESTTRRADLRLLTLLPFAGLFSHQSVFRAHRAWCAACHKEQRDLARVVYEPLLWSIALVLVCPVHRQPLEERCPHCASPMTPLTVFTRPGYCSRCQGWLGASPGTHRPGCRHQPEKETEEEVLHSELVGELLTAAPQLPAQSAKAVFTANFRACAHAAAEGNQLALAKTCRLPRSVIATLWTGERQATIQTFARICHGLNTPSATFLESDPQRDDAGQRWDSARQAVQRNRSLPLSRTATAVRLALKKAVQEQPAPSLSEMAGRLGYKGTERLYQVDRRLSKRIAANHRTSGQSHAWRKPGAVWICDQVDIRKLLEQSLAQEHPVSAHHLAARLGYANDGYLQRRFPDLCRAIRKKIGDQEKECIDKMEQTLKSALHEDPIPTLNELRKRLGWSSSETLRTHFPALCDEILEHRQQVRERRLGEVRRTLQRMLLRTSVLSIRKVSSEVGLSYSYLVALCPEECTALGARFKQWRKEASQHRKEELAREVEQIVQRLHHEGKWPSVGRVTAQLKATSLREWNTLTSAVKAAREQAGKSLVPSPPKKADELAN